MMLMLASDICRHILTQQPPALLARLQQHSGGGDEVVISAITYAELVAAAMLSDDQERHMQLVREFCQRLDEVLPWDAAAVDAYSQIQIQAMQGAYTLNMNDAMQAAHALSAEACLLCLSDASYARIERLDIELLNLD